MNPTGALPQAAEGVTCAEVARMVALVRWKREGKQLTLLGLLARTSESVVQAGCSTGPKQPIYCAKPVQ